MYLYRWQKGHILLVDAYLILSFKSTRELSNCQTLEFVQKLLHMIDDVNICTVLEGLLVPWFSWGLTMWPFVLLLKEYLCSIPLEDWSCDHLYVWKDNLCSVSLEDWSCDYLYVQKDYLCNVPPDDWSCDHCYYFRQGSLDSGFRMCALWKLFLVFT